MRIEIEGARVRVFRDQSCERPGGMPNARWQDTSDARARSESHFWYMLRDAFNERGIEGGGWKKIRQPGLLSSMPYALQLGRKRRQNRLVIDNDYATRAPHAAYNNGYGVSLSLFDAVADGRGGLAARSGETPTYILSTLPPDKRDAVCDRIACNIYGRMRVACQRIEEEAYDRAEAELREILKFVRGMR
jgi:hypothetical protein